jgi:outer membrane protein assembly factor BamE
MIDRTPARAAALAGCLFSGCLLSACVTQRADSFLGIITPYKVEVVQGNVVTQEMAGRLSNGLSREQVRNVLGSPLLTDVFHADRWDYVFTIRRQGAQPQQRSVTIFFEADRVSKFEATDLPSEREFVASISTAKVSGKVPNLQLSEKDINALPLPEKPAPSAADTAASGPVRTYPPLEPAAQ